MTLPKHSCLADGCGKLVPHGMAMCGRHWRLVPPDIQRTVYREYAAAKGDITNAHVAALVAARNSLKPAP